MGGAWRNLAILHMRMTDYPFRIVHQYDTQVFAPENDVTAVLVTPPTEGTLSLAADGSLVSSRIQVGRLDGTAPGVTPGESGVPKVAAPETSPGPKVGAPVVGRPSACEIGRAHV